MSNQHDKQALENNSFLEKEKIERTTPLQTPYGKRPARHWLLKNLFSIARLSNQPVCIAWGKDLIAFYNDAFAGLVERRHDQSEKSL